MRIDPEQQQQLDRLRNECEQRLDRSIAPDVFLPELLSLTEGDDRIFAAALWLLDQQGQVRLVADHRLGEFLQGDHLDIDAEHQQLLQQTLGDGRSRVASDRRIPSASLPPHSLVLAGVRNQSDPLGVLELYADESPGERGLQHIRQIAETLAAYVSRYFVRDRRPPTPEPAAATTAAPTPPATAPAVTPSPAAAPPGPPSDAAFWERFERLTLELQRSLDLDEVATVAVNDARQLLDCDRVSLALTHGPRTIIRAISGQDEVQRRSNQVQAMVRLAEHAMQGGVPLTYRGAVEDLPPSLQQPFADYLSESRMRMVHLLPLREPQPLPHHDEANLERDESRTRPVVGCLIVEQAAESRPRPGLIDQSDLVGDHIAAAIANSRRYESIFLLPVWRSLGRTLAWFRGRRLWIAAAIVAALAVIGLALAIVPWEYRVEATGQAMPVVRHGVFAPYDATVVDVLVESNQRVAAGTPMLRLESAQLDEQETRLKGEIARLEEESYKLRREQDEARRQGERETEQQVYTRYRQARTELEAQQAELEIVRAEQQKLNVTAPADGVVATFQIEQLLQDRPVQRGDLLLEVMDDAGDWRLELEVPEHRMGHLLQALAASETGDLPVDYVPATDARLDLAATLTDVATRSDQSANEGMIVQVYAAIDPDDLPGRRIGAEVDARIRCGRKSLFYCLFGDVVEFIQRKVWW